MRASFLVFVLLCLLNCRSKYSHNLDGENGSDSMTQATVLADDSLTSEVSRTRAAVREDFRIIMTGQFHSDEVEPDAAGRTWFGLFQEEEQFFIQPTEIVLSRFHDPLLDNEGEMSGWEVSVPDGRIPVVLISGLKCIAGPVPHLDIPSSIYPGDTVEVLFENHLYTFWATGENVEDSTSGQRLIYNYKLLVSRSGEGRISESVVVQHSRFDETFTSILWAGDINGDKRLDILIDLTDHYNVTAPTLFLSEDKESKSVVSFFAQHRAVGC